MGEVKQSGPLKVDGDKRFPAQVWPTLSGLLQQPATLRVRGLGPQSASDLLVIPTNSHKLPKIPKQDTYLSDWQPERNEAGAPRLDVEKLCCMCLPSLPTPTFDKHSSMMKANRRGLGMRAALRTNVAGLPGWEPRDSLVKAACSRPPTSKTPWTIPPPLLSFRPHCLHPRRAMTMMLDRDDHNDTHFSALPPARGYEDAADWMARLSSDSSAYLPHPLSSSSPPRLTNLTNSGLSIPDFFGPPPPTDSGNTLWTGDEQADIFGFLNQFEAPWEFNPVLPGDMPAYPGDQTMTYDGDAFDPRSSAHDGPDSNRHSLRDILASSSNTSIPSSSSTVVPPRSSSGTPSHLNPSRTSSGSGGTARDRPIKRSESSDSQSARPASASSNQQLKAPLSAPQKRLNHVKSEKRRRDTIRDGYLTLTRLLSPPNSQHLAIPIPRRGRPKGSGRAANGSGKKEGKGKSGVLFRAVEYVRFLEEDVRGLEEEIRRLEELGACIVAAPVSVSVGERKDGSRSSYQNGW